jgi:hypothetical protein
MNLLNDKRTLNSMLKLEENYTINGSYFNSKIQPDMRTKLATWMLEVCEEQTCTDEVFANAMNIFDRLMFSMNNTIEVQHLQLIGSVCLFISSKLAQTQIHKLTASKLVDYTDNSISLESLLEWELFIMDKLKWDVASIVPNEFVDCFLNSIEQLTQHSLLKKHCHAFTAMCATDFKFSSYSASLIAAASVLTACEGLNECPNQIIINIQQLASDLCNLAQCDYECLMLIKEQIDDLFQQSSGNVEQQHQHGSHGQSTESLINDIPFEDDYDFDIDFNMKISDNITEKRSNLLILSPTTTNLNTSRSSSGISSTSGAMYLNNSFLLSQSPSSSFSSFDLTSSSTASSVTSLYYTNQEIVSMMMITPPLANSLPMPQFDIQQEIVTKERSSKRRSQRQTNNFVNKNQMIRC